MKVCQLSLLVVGMLAASQISAAEPNRATLDAMGLSGIRVMSDSEGLAVRGLGFKGTSANGKSWANVSVPGANAGSVNSYSAQGGKTSLGASGSIAAVIIETGGGHGGGHDDYGQSSKGGHGGGGGGSKPQSVSIVAVSGGFSFGKIKH